MSIIKAILAPAAVLGLAASLGAQQPPRAPSQPRQPAPSRATSPDGENCTSTGEGRVECVRRVRVMGNDSAFMRRAALGLQVTSTGSVRDSLGVFVTSVSPKGPAENAGIIEGDRIVSINGVDLRLSAADAADSYTSGLPSHRLTREVGKLTPGNVANIRVYSGGRIRDVRVTLGRASDLMRGNRAFGFDFDGPMGSGNTFMYRTRPGQNFRSEGLGTPRMRIERFPRQQMLERGMEPLRMLSPLRVPGGSRVRIIERDGEQFIDADTIVFKRSDKRETEKGAAKSKKK